MQVFIFEISFLKKKKFEINFIKKFLQFFDFFFHLSSTKIEELQIPHYLCKIC